MILGLSNRHEYSQTACVKLSTSNKRFRDGGSERATLPSAFSRDLIISLSDM